MQYSRRIDILQLAGVLIAGVRIQLSAKPVTPAYLLRQSSLGPSPTLTLLAIPVTIALAMLSYDFVRIFS